MKRNECGYLRNAVLACVGAFWFLSVQKAVAADYDPMLDSRVTAVDSAARASSGEYMWYPGQLSAHLQQRRIAESGERCMKVGYPGKFYAPVYKTWFRKTVVAEKAVDVEWKATGKTSVLLDGAEKAAAGGKLVLPAGKHEVVFIVVADNNLPAIRVDAGGGADTEGWQASLDGEQWNRAEASAVFGTCGRGPLDDPEREVDIKPAEILAVRNAAVDGEGRVVIRKNGYVLADFFHIEIGKVMLTVRGRGRLTAFVGESPEEALNENEALFEQAAMEPRQLSGEEMRIVLPERALRYLKLQCDGECEVTEMTFRAKVWPVDFTMTFDCDDEQVNDIWKASVASLHTSTHGFYLDGVKRDYLPWSMDAVLSTFAGDYVFSDEQVSRNSLSVALMPLNPQRSDMGIPDYPLHALPGFWQHYKRYGDMGTVLSYRDRMEQLLAFYETLQDERGFISASAGGVSWGFVPGWATRQGPDKKGTPAYAQIMLCYNYQIGSRFARMWGDRKAARHYASKAAELRKSIMRHFWDEERGMFVNGYDRNGKKDSTVSHHAQYWAVLAGMFPQEHIDRLFEKVNGIPYYRTDVSYEKGYEFMAYAKARKTAEMWDFLRDVFGDWLEQGHSRFPENFSYKKPKNDQLVFYKRPYGLSLCHGANGVPGVVAVLNGIAGFSQSDTEFNHYTLCPDMMDLKRVDVAFPVKEGIIRMHLSADGASRIEIPGGCRVDFVSKSGRKKTFSREGSYAVSVI